MVRELLGGRFANTAFVLFNPSGTRMLSKTGRSPNQGLSSSRGPGRGASDSDVVSEMDRIARRYEPKGNLESAELQDFHSLKQSLNVASADQRLLVLVNAPKSDHGNLAEKLKPVFADSETIGKFHLDFLGEKTDKNWTAAVKGSKTKPGIMIVQSSQFGLDGKVVDQLELNESVDEIKKALLNANKKFAKVEKRKDYSAHVREGRRQGIKFESEIPYGEDRDGDGEIDKRGRREPQRGGRRGRRGR